MDTRSVIAAILGAALAGVLCFADEKLTGEEVRQQETVVDNLARIGHAVHEDYYAEHRRFPPHAISRGDGTELLSWRVAILPFVGEGDLFKQFRLDEAWNSDHNKKLIEKMPAIYLHPRAKTKEKGMTFFRVFVGTGAAFEPGRRLQYEDFFDGTMSVVLLVEAADAVPWTKPAELPYIHEKPLPKLGGHFTDGFFAVTCFGEVRKLSQKFDAPTMRFFILRNDGMEIDFKKLTGEK